MTVQDGQLVYFGAGQAKSQQARPLTNRWFALGREHRELREQTGGMVTAKATLFVAFAVTM